MEGQPTGLLERLRAQRESMTVAGAPEESPITAEPEMPLPPSLAMPAPVEETRSRRDDPAELSAHQIERIDRLESGRDDLSRRLDSVEASLRQGLVDLRSELPTMPTMITGEVARHTTATNEAVAAIGGRMGRLESEFTRERERWSNVVTSFDQRLDQRLRSFRQDVTVMLTGMAVLILATLMMLLLRR